jgi:hypothetical protein
MCELDEMNIRQSLSECEAAAKFPAAGNLEKVWIALHDFLPPRSKAADRGGKL